MVNAVKLSLPFIFILTAAAFIIGVINLAPAELGNPYGPHYFPMGVAVLILLLSIVYLLRVFKERHLTHEEDEDIKNVFTRKTLMIIGSAIVFGLIYALIFEPLGYLLSTTLYLGALMFVINGKEKWLRSILSTLIFTFVSWYVFAEMLSISLP